MFRARAGFTLMEVLVVMAILVVVAAVGVPAVGGLLDLQQKAAVDNLARTYIWLRDEAALRNVTFRIAYNLDDSTWKVEVGDPGSLVFSTPEDRAEHDEAVAEKMRRFTEREIEEGAAAEIEEASGRFEGLDDPSMKTDQALPDGLIFAFVYTPQYGEDGVRPREKDDKPDDDDQPLIAYSYIFPDGSAEHAVIRIIDEEDPEDGYTLEVEPLSGKVAIHEEMIDPQDSLKWLPDSGPSLR